MSGERLKRVLDRLGASWSVLERGGIVLSRLDRVAQNTWVGTTAGRPAIVPPHVPRPARPRRPRASLKIVEAEAFPKSHQPSGLRWLSALYWSQPLPLPLPPPQDPRPGGSRGVGDSYCDYFGNLVALLFCIVFRCLFGSILAPVSLPTCLPKSIKIQEKSMPRCHPSWTPFFDRFLVGFGSQLGPI